MHWRDEIRQGSTLVASLAVACSLAFSASCSCNLICIACIPRVMIVVMLHASSAPPGNLDLGIYHTEGNACMQGARVTQKAIFAFKQHNPFAHWRQVTCADLEHHSSLESSKYKSCADRELCLPNCVCVFHAGLLLDCGTAQNREKQGAGFLS